MSVYNLRLTQTEMNALNFALSLAVDSAYDALKESFESKSDLIVGSWQEAYKEIETIYYRIATLKPEESDQ